MPDILIAKLICRLFEKLAVNSFEARNNITSYKLENGNVLNVIAEGKLVNIAAADGHPAEIMDMSFAIQALSALYIKNNYKELPNAVIEVRKKLMSSVSARKLKAWGIEIDELTIEQKEYLNSWQA